MAGPRKVTREEYDEFRSRMEEKYGYEGMSDEEKKDFDEKIDKVAVVGEKTENADDTGDNEDDELEKGEFDDGHPRGGGDDEEIR